MEYDVNGAKIQANDNGYLDNHTDWNEDVANTIAKTIGIELTEKHWDIMNYLRNAYINEGGNQPNERTILKAMSKQWGVKASSKDMYELFPGMPSKQGAKIAGLPESRRKGGY